MDSSDVSAPRQDGARTREASMTNLVRTCAKQPVSTTEMACFHWYLHLYIPSVCNMPDTGRRRLSSVFSRFTQIWAHEGMDTGRKCNKG